jgi:tripartite-type tricarboxylate transporter receptor subunit TctC
LRFALLGALFAGFNFATAQTYPAKPVRMIVPFATGGGTDIVGRAVAQKIGEAFGQSVIVDNKTGANGNIGMELAAKAPPDGYTIIMTSSALAINPSMYKGMGYDAVNDFAPVSLATLIPIILVVNSALPVNSVRELVALAHNRKKELSYAPSGSGNATHLSMALLEMMTKIEMNHVPHKGTGQSITDVMGGHVQLMFGAIPSTIPGVRARKLKILAISSAQRSAALRSASRRADGRGSGCARLRAHVVVRGAGACGNTGGDCCPAEWRNRQGAQYT